jgi:hypothetical protein
MALPAGKRRFVRVSFICKYLHCAPFSAGKSHNAAFQRGDSLKVGDLHNRNNRFTRLLYLWLSTKLQDR